MNNRDLDRFVNITLKKYLSASKPYSPAIEKNLQASYKTKYRFRSLDATARSQLLETRLSSLSDSEMDLVWAAVFKKTEYLGLGSIAVDYFKKKQKRKNPPLHSHWPLLESWIEHIENWVHGDMIASLYSQMLEENPKPIFPRLKNWAHSKKPWKKRMGMISLMYYYACRDQVLDFDQMLPLVEKNLDVDHYFVQKGVGWTLREMHNAYPAQTKTFIKNNLHRLSSYAFSASTEKIDPKTKAPWKEIRKQFRKNEMRNKYD